MNYTNKAEMETTEQERIETLQKYNILDTPPDGAFDKMTQLAALIFNLPISIITLVDTDRIWFKSKYGLDATQITRDPGLCASAILSEDVYLIEDARNDPRTLANPLVAGNFGLQFYAAAPLKTKDGFSLGTFCVIDKQKRFFNSEQKKTLQLFADIVMEQLEFRLDVHNELNEMKMKLDTLEKR